MLKLTKIMPVSVERHFNTWICIQAWCCINLTVVIYFKQGNIKQTNNKQWGHSVTTLSLFVWTCTVIAVTVSDITWDIWMNTTQRHPWANQFDSYMLKQRHICVLCIYLHNSTSYLVEALQTLLDLSQDRVWDAYFDFWVLPLGVQTISHNSARITETKGETDF